MAQPRTYERNVIQRIHRLIPMNVQEGVSVLTHPLDIYRSMIFVSSMTITYLCKIKDNKVWMTKKNE